MKSMVIMGLMAGWLVASTASAGVCDYRPSHLVGAAAASTVAGGAGATAATGIGMKAAGFYSLVHATSGLTMLGSTAAGASAAGTVGIIAGTGGLIGTIGAALMTPFVVVPAAVTAVGLGALEGGCYLVD